MTLSVYLDLLSKQTHPAYNVCHTGVGIIIPGLRLIPNAFTFLRLSLSERHLIPSEQKFDLDLQLPRVHVPRRCRL